MAILVERDHIGIFGKMNAGKSSIMNLITQQETSIVDATPGTTADTKIALQEIHGLGPVKIFDTAGADEQAELGTKKRRKILNDLKECDVILLIIDPARAPFQVEHELLLEARELDKQILVIYNLFQERDAELIANVENSLPILQFYPKISLSANQIHHRQDLLEFILRNYQSRNAVFNLLPFLVPDEYYVLIIPMDDETPPGRYLRPQAMVEEFVARNWAYPVSFRMNLGAARENPLDSENAERKRFEAFLNNFKQRPRCIITDSQAMDIMNLWCPEDMELTTFSIIMINYMSRGKLERFVEGVRQVDQLENGDRILIVEACNHSRVGEDIGTVQIPRYLKSKCPDLVIEHNFGREFQENDHLSSYKLIIHCGGCMITAQKLQARIRDLEAIGIPYTNYGVFLSFIQGEKALRKVLSPWKISCSF